MLEYGLPADNFNFPVQFLQIDFSPLKTGKTEQFKKLKKKVKEFQLPFFIAENHCYLWLPQSRQQEYFSAFESAIPFLELPHLGIKTSRKIIYSREKKLIIENNPLIMGILNVTPDSFSDGGLYVSCNKAVEHGKQMLKAGAKIIDIGGESTRPGAGKVDENEEWNRVGETIKKLSHQLPDDSMISIDTYKSGVAEKALQNGAHIINDISGLTFDPKMAEVAVEYNAPVIMMHIKG
ncbi:MAG: dihydropteroate synthase, partial [Calditrichia bacterium]|nr:dihydropteroate synthase [Calditrichia bacterium]